MNAAVTSALELDGKGKTMSGAPSRYVPSGMLALTLIFLGALAVRLWFNFATVHVNCASSCDASEYLRNAAALLGLQELPVSFWQDALACLTGQTAGQESIIAAQLSTLREMHQSSPVFPLFLLSSFVLSGAPFDVTNLMPPVVAQSIISALTCVLVALIGFYGWSKRTGYVAGVFAAFYPAFIVNSGRLYTETFAAFLLCLVTWLTMRSYFGRGNGYLNAFAAGITAAALQLTRSIMVAGCLALVPLTFLGMRRRRPLLAVAALAAGFALVVAPWFALQKLTFGKVSAVVDRAGHYNFFVGNNVESNGLLAYPYPNCVNLDARSYPSILKESIKQDPLAWLQLTVDKSVRLLKLPWNDFRTSIGPFKPDIQSAFHQFLLALAALGVVIGLTTNVGKSDPERRQLGCRLAIAGIAALHFIYVLFITVPRYNLTAMPFVVLFSAAGVVWLTALIQQRASRRRALVVAVLVIVLYACARANLVSVLSAVPFLPSPNSWLVVGCALKFLALAAFLISLWQLIPFLKGNARFARGAVLLLGPVLFVVLCLPLRAHGRWWEWACTLEPGRTITQNIAVPGNLTPPADRPCFLLIDSDGDLKNVDVTVNGRRLDGSVIPSLSLLPEIKEALRDGKIQRRECEYIFDCMTQATGISNRDLRQWFFIPVSPEIIAGCHGSLDVGLTQKGTGASKLFGSYNIDDNWILTPSLTLYSWEKAFYGVENDGGTTDTRYDARLRRLTPPSNYASDLSGEPGLQTGAYNVRLLVADSKSATSRSITQALFSGPGLLDENHQKEILPVTGLPAYDAASLWLVTVMGQVKGTVDGVDFGAELAADFEADQTQPFSSYRSPWALRRLPLSMQWQPFQFSLPLQPGFFAGRLRNLEVALHRRGQRSMAFAAASKDKGAVEFKDVAVRIVPLSSNPMSSGYRVF